MRKVLLALFFVVVSAPTGWAQCAMCRVTLENNVSNGNIGIAAGINTGILYLFFAPYLAVGVIAFFWFRSSKFHEQELSKSALGR